MICDGCDRQVELIIDCPCGAAICHDCYYQHDCAQKEKAHLRRPIIDDPPQRDRQVNAGSGEFNLRPYQQQAIEAIIEALT